MVRGAAVLTGIAVLIAAIAGCAPSPHHVVDTHEVKDVPACVTWPVDLVGQTFYAYDREDYEEVARTHPDPREQSAPQPSAAWEDEDDGRGVLYLYDDGVALFVAVTGNVIWFSPEEREWDTVC